jgi:hypothetical protein
LYYFATHIRAAAALVVRETSTRFGRAERAFRRQHSGVDTGALVPYVAGFAKLGAEDGKLTYYDSLEDAIAVHERNMTRQ